MCHPAWLPRPGENRRGPLGDYDVLTRTALGILDAVGHGRSLPTRRQTSTPELLAGLDIESAEVVSQGSADEDQSTLCNEGAAEARNSYVDVQWDACKIADRPERPLPEVSPALRSTAVRRPQGGLVQGAPSRDRIASRRAPNGVPSWGPLSPQIHPAVEHKEQPHLRSLNERGHDRAVTDEINERGLCRNIVVPKIVMDGLKTPHDLRACLKTGKQGSI
jgi:hypothetical protein